MATKRTDVAARLKVESSEFKAGLDQANGHLSGFGKKVEATAARMRTAMKNTGMGNVAGRLRGWGTSIAAFAGVYGIGAAVHQVQQFEDALEDLRRFGRKDYAWMAETRAEILRVSDSTGVAKEQLAAFGNKFVELTGDADAAREAMKSMAKVSVATGTDMSTLAEMMELLSGTFDVKGAEAMSAVLGKLATQALLGTMSFKNIAATIGQVGGIAAAQLGAKGEEGATDIAGLMQLIVRVTRGPEETKTATLRFMESISRKHEKFKELTGISLTTGYGESLKFKRISEMTRLIGKGLAKATPEQLQELNKEVFQDARARRATAAILQAYRGGWGQKQGTWAAPTTLFAAKGTEGGVPIIEKMYQEAHGAPGHRIRQAMSQMSNEIHRNLLPAFLELSKVLPKLVPYLRWTIQHITDLITAWAAFKGVKFFYTLQKLAQVSAAAGGAGGAGVTGVMNVTATTVNVMGGPGVTPTPTPTGGGGPAKTGVIAGAALAVTKAALVYQAAGIAYDAYHMITKGRDFDAREGVTTMMASMPEKIKKEYGRREFGEGEEITTGLSADLIPDIIREVEAKYGGREQRIMSGGYQNFTEMLEYLRKLPDAIQAGMQNVKLTVGTQSPADKVAANSNAKATR